MTRTIVFTRTKRGADRVAKHLEAAGVTAAAIHGDKSQAQRERALATFKAGNTRALVATDIAARGIDIDSVSHVINFELPYVAEAYVHRIGRTARAGASGQAISLCADDERNLVRDIQRLTRQTIPAVDRRRDQSLKLMAQTRPAETRSEAPQGRGRSNGGGEGGHGRRDGQAPRRPRPQGQGAGHGAPGQGQGRGRQNGGGASAKPAPRSAPGRSDAGSGRWSPMDS
jgi:ATP-dependent RNA helicase RhlE